MLDLFFEAISPVNLPFTALLGLVVFYWLFVAVGMLDFDSGPHLEVGGGTDIDLAPHPGGHLEAAGESFQGVMKSALQFLNFGNVPSMIVISILVVSLWTGSMIGNHYFNNGAWGRALLLSVPNLLLAVGITRLATTPLKTFFGALNRDYEEHKPVVGRTCTIITSEVTDNFGQAQIETSGAPLLINVRTYGEAMFQKGETALIIKEDKENNSYTIAKLTTTTPQQETSVC